jgi:RNA polymerase sigma factor (sigma-70 family)
MMQMMCYRMFLLKCGKDWKILEKIVSCIHGCRIATNECLTFLEQQKKKSSVSLSDVEAGLSNKVKADDNFNSNKLEWKLQLAIQQLPEKQRLVFNLRYYDEMPYEEMSKILETSEGALKASYHHAAKKIEDFIKSN